MEAALEDSPDRVGKTVRIFGRKDLSDLARHDQFLQSPDTCCCDRPARADSSRGDRRRGDPAVRQRQHVAGTEPARHLLLGYVLVFPKNPVANRTCFPELTDRSRVLEDLADDRNAGAGLADDPGRSLEQDLDSLVGPDQAQEQNEPAVDP